MPDDDIFNTPSQEAQQLAEELRQVKEVVRDISRTLTRIETRARRAFPSAFPKLAARERGVAGNLATAPPTMTREQVMAIYDQAVTMAKSGDTEGSRRQIEALEMGDLNLLRTELGAAIGKKKPSKSVLLRAVLGRLSESVMLGKHTNRQELIGRSEARRHESNASDEGTP